LSRELSVREPAIGRRSPLAKRLPLTSETTGVPYDYSGSQIRDAVEDVTEWDRRDAVDIWAGKTTCAYGRLGIRLGAGRPSVPRLTSNPADRVTSTIGHRYEMFRPRRVPLR
jgi:hypothetical protein